MPAILRTTALTALLTSLLAIGCAHRSPAPLTPLQQAWHEARSAGGHLIENEDALRQRLVALDRFARVRDTAEREARCAAEPEARRAHCLEGGLDRIEVTGSRISAADVITNNQEAGIEEGGIVKKSGDYLIVLRSGTLYSIALREGGSDSLLVVDRLLAAEDDSGRGVWYDEILALDGRIILLGYGDGSQLIGFDLDDAGRLHRRWHYTLSSNDYYSGDNYGMRLHGEHLVFKLSIEVDAIERMRWPTWRHADVPDGERHPLVDSHQILLPGLVSEYPQLHLLLSCPLSALDAGRIDCRARGAMGDGHAELYVAGSTAYLALSAWDDALYLDPQFNAWGFSPTMDWEQLQAHRQTWLVRVPLDRADPPGFARIRGELRNQFWLKEADGELHVLSSMGHAPGSSLLLHRLSPRDFGTENEALFAPHRRLDGPTTGPVRLTEQAAYIARTPKRESEAGRASLTVVPLRGAVTAELGLDFEPRRLEPALGHVVVIGESSSGGLGLALLTDRAAPTLLDRTGIDGLRESEHRSHAFNAGSPTPGSRVFGLPVVRSGADPDAEYDAVSDLLLMDMSANRLRQLGLVDMASSSRPEPECELSCVDWYGNARVFFIGERLFALSADQLVELRLHGDALREVARIRLSD